MSAICYGGKYDGEKNNKSCHSSTPVLLWNYCLVKIAIMTKLHSTCFLFIAWTWAMLYHGNCPLPASCGSERLRLTTEVKCDQTLTGHVYDHQILWLVSLHALSDMLMSTEIERKFTHKLRSGHKNLLGDDLYLQTGQCPAEFMTTGQFRSGWKVESRNRLTFFN